MLTQKFQEFVIAFVAILALAFICTEAAAAGSAGPFHPEMTMDDAYRHCEDITSMDTGDDSYLCRLTPKASREFHTTPLLSFSHSTTSD